jgi:hypothetical protein
VPKMTEPKESLRRLDDLLLSRAVEGLRVDEEAALRELLTQHPDADEHVYDRAAAAVWLATLTHVDPMPERVKRVVAARAKR